MYIYIHVRKNKQTYIYICLSLSHSLFVPGAEEEEQEGNKEKDGAEDEADAPIVSRTSQFDMKFARRDAEEYLEEAQDAETPGPAPVTPEARTNPQQQQQQQLSRAPSKSSKREEEEFRRDFPSMSPEGEGEEDGDSHLDVGSFKERLQGLYRQTAARTELLWGGC